MSDFTDVINEMVRKMNDMKEQQLINDLKEKGIIVDACLICSPKVAADIKQVLYDNKIQIPIVIHRFCEDEKLYMVTDKEIVENVKKNIGWMGENSMEEISREEPKRCPFCGLGTIVEGGSLFTHKCECNGCHASTGSYKTWEDAVKAWNRRDYGRD